MVTIPEVELSKGDSSTFPRIIAGIQEPLTVDLQNSAEPNIVMQYFCKLRDVT